MQILTKFHHSQNRQFLWRSRLECACKLCHAHTLISMNRLGFLYILPYTIRFSTLFLILFIMQWPVPGNRHDWQCSNLKDLDKLYLKHCLTKLNETSFYSFISQDTNVSRFLIFRNYTILSIYYIQIDKVIQMHVPLLMNILKGT